MNVLWPHLPYQPGETPASFMGRLAMRHGMDDPKLLGQMLGIDFRSVAKGDPRHIQALAAVADVDATVLLQSAIRTDRKGIGTYRNERLAAFALHRGFRRICPRCLLDDVEASGLPASWAACGRTIWMLSAIRTCPVHGLPLVEIGLAPERFVFHEFNRCVAPALRDLERLARSHGPRPLSDLETYLLRRLDGSNGQTPWRDSLEGHAAAKLCEMVGLVARNGRRASMRGRTEAEWHAAGQAGFVIVAPGPEGLRTVLEDLWRTSRHQSAASAGCRSIFGTLYDWLTNIRHQSAFEPVRDAARQAIAEMMPLGAGDKVLGTALEVRKLHSIRTLSIAVGRDRRRVRKILFAAGLAAAEQRDDWDHHVVFDAAVAERVIAKYGDALALPAVAKVLDCSLVQVKRLVAAGFLRPIPLFARTPGLAPVYARTSVVAFRAALLRHTVPIDAAPANLCSIAEAVRRANCTVKALVALILRAELATIRLDRRKSGYTALLVSPQEVVSALAQPADSTHLKIREAEAALGLTAGVTGRLIRKKVIPAWSGIHPTSRRRVTLVSSRDIEAFKARYIAASEIAALLDTNCQGVVHHLRALGVEPEAPHASCGVSFYLRSDIVNSAMRERLASSLGATQRRRLGRKAPPQQSRGEGRQ